MKTIVSNGGIPVQIEPIKEISNSKKTKKIQNPSLEKAQRVVALIASHC